MDDLEKLLEFESEQEKENFNKSLKCKHHPCFNGDELYCDYPNCESYEIGNNDKVSQMKEHIEKITKLLGLSEENKEEVYIAISQIETKGVLNIEDFVYHLGSMFPGVFKALMSVTKLNSVDAYSDLRSGKLKSTLLVDIFNEYSLLLGL